MDDNQPPIDTQGMSQEEVNHASEKACGERVQYALEKFGCTLVPIIELRAGQVIARIDIQKVPPEVLKQLKKAKASGQQPGFGPSGA